MSFIDKKRQRLLEARDKAAYEMLAARQNVTDAKTRKEFKNKCDVYNEANQAYTDFVRKNG